jgi:hypothetical protein
MEDQKLRQWAIEQAIAMHGTGRSMEVIIGEAQKLIAWVSPVLIPKASYPVRGSAADIAPMDSRRLSSADSAAEDRAAMGD